jgi:hypothetical protein
MPESPLHVLTESFQGGGLIIEGRISELLELPHCLAKKSTRRL